MLTMPLTREIVIELSRQMPSFPRVVSEIIATVDNPDGTLNALVQSIEHDPVIAARVLAAANRASDMARREAPVEDIYAATALIGMARVREIALISSMSGFVETLGANARYRQLWLHSIAVAVAVQEVSRYTDQAVALESALVAGLLHNIGQYWFFACAAQEYRECIDGAIQDAVPLEAAERQHFGADHAQVGSWLLAHWQLPAAIAQAVGGYPTPDAHAGNVLVAVIHVAKVISDALDLARSRESRVTHVSAAACELLGMVWNADVHLLFGRIEARSRHANAFFDSADEFTNRPLPTSG